MEWNCRAALGVILPLALFSSPAWAGSITIQPITDDLYTSSSNVDIPGVGDKTLYSLSFVPTTNIDHTIAILAGGTLNAVGDSLTLPIQLTNLSLFNYPEGRLGSTPYLTINGTQPIGSITIDYTRNNEGGTFTATLPVDLLYTPTGTTFADTLRLQGDWSIFGPIFYPNPAYSLYPPNGFYIGDDDGNRQLFNETGTDVHDVGYLAGPEPGTFGLFGVAMLVGLAAARRKLSRTTIRR
jgi:hypothetical protein